MVFAQLALMQIVYQLMDDAYPLPTQLGGRTALDENDPNWVNYTADAAAAQAGAGLGVC
jgi:hypothetical protein